MIGTNQSDLCQLSAPDLDRVCGDIAAYGFTSVRFAADWGWLSNLWGSVNYKPLERVADALDKHKLTALPAVGIHYPRFHSPASFKVFTERVVDIYGPLPAYEVWNEPNLNGFSIGTPAKFLTYLKAAAPVIRAAGSAVIHGGLAAFPDRRSWWARDYSPTTWLNELYAAGESNDYDLFGYHPYSFDTAQKWCDPTARPFGIDQIAQLDACRARRGDVRPYAFTEIGYDTAKVDAVTAARHLCAQMPAMRQQSNHNWLFCWRDTAGDGGKYGLVNANNTRKLPLYNAVRELI